MCSSWAVITLRRLYADISSYEDGRNIAPDVLNSFCLSLELVYRELLVQHPGEDEHDQVCELVRQALSNLLEIYDSQLITTEYRTPAVNLIGAVGRPRLKIPQEQIRLLIELRLTVPQIADVIGVSVRTIHRRMVEYGLSIQSTYSEMTDQEIDNVISDIQKEFPM